MRRLAVISIATSVLRTGLMQMCQMREEFFRSFAARVRGKADKSAFSADCSCGLKVNYTDHMIRDTLLNGIFDFDIRREILGTTDILTTAVNDVIVLIESKEMVRNAIPAPDVFVTPILGAKKRPLLAKTVAHLYIILLQLTCRSNLSVLVVRNSSTCIEKALVSGTPNRTPHASIASAHNAAPCIAISRHLHQLLSQTLIDCLKAQAI